MRIDLAIKGWESISPCGILEPNILAAYQKPKHALAYKEHWHGKIPTQAESELQAFIDANRLYKKLDRSAQLGIWVAHQLHKKNIINPGCGVFAGSSRGATELLEAGFQHFLETGTAPSQTSPHTTAGNIASFIAQSLGGNRIEQSYSITCSTFSHGVANAAAWINSGMATQMAIFGCEAPLTPFTFSQMHALGIYSRETDTSSIPCQALVQEKKSNSMVLGEGAFGLVLEKDSTAEFHMPSLGMAKENVSSASGVTAEGDGLLEAMQQASDAADGPIDAIVTHAPGTVLGDSSEIQAIHRLFGKTHPPLTNNKWKMGHTFGASAGLSLEMALLMLKYQELFQPPYLDKAPNKTTLKNILVNAIGFGGNAISMCISRRD